MYYIDFVFFNQIVSSVKLFFNVFGILLIYKSETDFVSVKS